MLQRGRETWKKERRETVRERDIWEERKSEKTYHEREKMPKNYVSHGYRRI